MAAIDAAVMSQRAAAATVAACALFRCILRAAIGAAAHCVGAAIPEAVAAALRTVELALEEGGRMRSIVPHRPVGRREPLAACGQHEQHRHKRLEQHLRHGYLSRE